MGCNSIKLYEKSLSCKTASVTAFEVYKIYLSLKKHFSDKKYDYFKYHGKTRASVESYNKRKDRYFFEKISRKLNDKEIKDYFVSNFVASDNPSSVWIGEIIHSGEKNYIDWKKRQESLTYNFKQESLDLFENHKLSEVFDCSKSHPILLKKFMSSKISIETMVIYDNIFDYIKNFDNKLLDPVWETVSLRISKYKPFLNIQVIPFRIILKDIIQA